MAKPVVDSANNSNRDKLTCLQLNNQPELLLETHRSTTTDQNYMSNETYICKIVS